MLYASISLSAKCNDRLQLISLIMIVCLSGTELLCHEIRLLLSLGYFLFRYIELKAILPHLCICLISGWCLTVPQVQNESTCFYALAEAELWVLGDPQGKVVGIVWESVNTLKET